MSGNWDWQVFCTDTLTMETVPGCYGRGDEYTYLNWLVSAWGWTLAVSACALVLALLGACQAMNLYGLQLADDSLQRRGVLAALWLVAALMALLLGFSPKFGAFIQAIPLPVMGGVSIVVFGLITIAGAKIWVDNKVDFTDPANLLTAAITLVLGTGDFTLKFGDFALGGIGTATFGAVLLHALLRRRT